MRAGLKVGTIGWLVALPLLGIVLVGAPVRQYMEFPPVTQHVPHAVFSWWAFALLAVGLAAFTGPFLLHHFRARILQPRLQTGRIHAGAGFPWWGWIGLLAGVLAWVLAWTRFEWFAPWQRFTFSPLWFAYIVVVNAWTWQRTGHCMLKDRPGYTVRLFVASAAFWWYFEYLNRFVQNWFYVDIGSLSPLQYFVFATLPFSTVLPAVLGTKELLATFPAASAGLENFRPVSFPHPRRAAAAAFVAASTGLLAIGIWPDYVFPMLWLAPLVVFTSVQVLAGQTTVFAGVETGNWRHVWLLAVSALICGFFWEMWNSHSLARWVYSVPFVQQFHIFEMPLLGYAGYLPFGLECAVIADLLCRREDA